LKLKFLFFSKKYEIKGTDIIEIKAPITNSSPNGPDNLMGYAEDLIPNISCPK
jgi:hypothetical protein